MKKIVSALLLITLIFSLAGCGAASKPEDTVTNFFEAAKQFDFEKMAVTINPDNTGDLDAISTASDHNEMEQYFLDYLKQTAAKITYEIKSSEISDDTATVTVACKYVDSTPLITATISEFFKQAIAVAFTGTQLTDEQTSSMMLGIMEEAQASTEVGYSEVTVEIACIKIDDIWLIDSVDEEIGDIITSNFITAFEEISSSFGGNAD